MSMIRVEDLTFSYPSSPDFVFEYVSFQIDTDWKLGFVGRNGRGKTTFLNLLLGKYEYRGTIQSSVEFDYFPYPVPHGERLAAEVLEEICPQAQEWELLRELSYLEMDGDALWRPFHSLSNGEQTKLLLAALFLNEGHFLLIDEPTNHLDLAAREAVSAYLKRKRGYAKGYQASAAVLTAHISMVGPGGGAENISPILSYRSPGTLLQGRAGL